MKTIKPFPFPHSWQDPLPSGAREIVGVLRSKGHEALLDGGSVRDMLLGRPFHDMDIATSASPQEVLSLFRHTFAVGEAFGVVVVRLRGISYEVATFRSEGGYEDGRHPSHVVFSSPDQDAMRRDFTVNALFYDPASETIIDYVAGLQDVQTHVLRAVGSAADRFQEDHLRMLRAVRFAAQLGFEIEEATWKAIQANADRIASVSQERITSELVRILSSDRPSLGCELLVTSGLMRKILPELSRAEETAASLQRAIRCLDLLDRAVPEQGLAALLSILDAPGPKLKPLLSRLRLSADQADRVAGAIEGFRRIPTLPQETLRSRKRAYRGPAFEDALALRRAWSLETGAGLDAWKACSEERAGMRREDLFPERLITGDDLLAMGCPEGRGIGEILLKLEDEQLEGRILDRSAALNWLREAYGWTPPMAP